MYVESAPASGLSCVRNCSHDPRETLELNMSTSTDPGGGTVLGVANRFEKIRESNLAPTSPDPRQGDRARWGPAWSVGPRCNLVRIHLPPEPDESRGWGPPQRVHSEGFFVGPPIKESPKGFPQVGARLENVHVVPVGPMKVPPKRRPKKKGRPPLRRSLVRRTQYLRGMMTIHVLRGQHPCGVTKTIPEPGVDTMHVSCRNENRR